MSRKRRQRRLKRKTSTKERVALQEEQKGHMLLTHQKDGMYGVLFLPVARQLGGIEVREVHDPNYPHLLGLVDVSEKDPDVYEEIAKAAIECFRAIGERRALYVKEWNKQLVISTHPDRLAPAHLPQPTPATVQHQEKQRE